MSNDRARPSTAPRGSREARPGATGVVVALVLVACSDPGATSGGSLPACGAAGPTVVFDIDETLTIADEEFVKQLQDGAYEPVGRAGGAELAGDYAARGYFVLYLTARTEEMVLSNTQETARDATHRWLDQEGYPLERALLSLAPTNAEASGEPARAYKAAKMRELQQAGHTFAYAYGNSATDVAAYADAKIDPGATFIIGELTGSGGTRAVAGEDWLAHRTEHAGSVPAVCEP